MSLGRLPYDAELTAVERVVEKALQRECRAFSRKQPEVIVIANEADPRAAKTVLTQKQREIHAGRSDSDNE